MKEVTSMMKKIINNWLTLMWILSIYSSVIYAEDCKVNIGYSNGIFNENITDYQMVTIKEGSSKSINLNHMRKVWNEANLDVEVFYTHGFLNLLSNTRIIKKGEKSFKQQGNIQKIKCIASKQLDIKLPSELEQNLEADTSRLWDVNKGIHVCWENPSNRDVEERNWVESAIRSSWEKHSKLLFYGWDKCKNSDTVEIRIKIEDIVPWSRIGRSTTINRPTMKLNFTESKIKIQQTAIHEFGHAIGFTHEHSRGTNPEEKCELYPYDDERGDYYVTPYDSDSIMNYCNISWSGNGQLSQKDIEGVQKMYGFPYFFSDNYYSITSIFSNKCLDVSKSNKNNGGNIIEYECKSTTNQMWRLHQVLPNYYELIAKHSGKCLDVKGSSHNNGVELIQYTCNQTTNQLWKIIQAQSSYDYNIRPYHSGKCLDSPWFGGWFSNKKIIQYECNDSRNQLWELRQK